MDCSGVEIEKVQFTLVAFGKRCYSQAGVDKFIGIGTLLAAGGDGPDAAGHKIAEDIETLQIRNVTPAIHIAAGNRVAHNMSVLGDGVYVIGRTIRRGIEAVCTFALTPSVILADLDAIHFFPAVLPDVAHPQLPGLPVETETPRIAKSPGENPRAVESSLALRAFRIPRKRVVRRYLVWRHPVNVHSHDRRQDIGCVLTVLLRVTAAPSVTETRLQEPIGSECEVAAVVIAGKLRNRQQDFLGRLVEHPARWVDNEA